MPKSEQVFMNMELRCIEEDLSKLRFEDDRLETETSTDQIEVENSVEICFKTLKDNLELNPDSPVLNKEAHIRFLKQGLTILPSSLEMLDASRPWLCYWILHSLALLNEPISAEIKEGVIEFLKACQHPDGGFGGGPGQDAHLAPTYAAVNALITLDDITALEIIDRDSLLKFLFRLKQPDGSFRLHEGSEIDIRGVYCALSIAMLTNIWCSQLTHKTAHWISRCQTYEGGFGGVPGMEAHGGLTFCGIAALTLLQETQLINMNNLLRWLVFKQMKYEGGFQGRTNKLVDSCYSFWQGGTFPILNRLINRTAPESLNKGYWLFDQRALQEYLLVCCQAPHGGMIDKPGKPRDFYHTCYALSGLSIAQHYYHPTGMYSYVMGHSENATVQTHPIYNICVPRVIEAIQFFQKLPLPESFAKIMAADTPEEEEVEFI